MHIATRVSKVMLSVVRSNHLLGGEVFCAERMRTLDAPLQSGCALPSTECRKKLHGLNTSPNSLELPVLEVPAQRKEF